MTGLRRCFSKADGSVSCFPQDGERLRGLIMIVSSGEEESVRLITGFIFCFEGVVLLLKRGRVLFALRIYERLEAKAFHAKTQETFCGQCNRLGFKCVFHCQTEKYSL